MSALIALLSADVPAPLDPWFERLAETLLNDAALLIQGQPHRLLEIELYVQREDHPDPFAHGSALQRALGRWYLHRQGPSLRGGTYKGLDISLGPEGVVGGALIRALQTPSGQRVEGCSRCVDHILSGASSSSLRDLDQALAPRHVWEPGGPLRLVEHAWPERRQVVATARVGLTLERAHPTRDHHTKRARARMGEPQDLSDAQAIRRQAQRSDLPAMPDTRRAPSRDDVVWPQEHTLMPAYLLRPYRFTTALDLTKGKVHTILALHKRGMTPAQIQAATRADPRALARRLAAYEAAYEAALTPQGSLLALARERQPWGATTLCRLHGAWDRCYGA